MAFGEARKGPKRPDVLGWEAPESAGKRRTFRAGVRWGAREKKRGKAGESGGREYGRARCVRAEKDRKGQTF